MGRPAEFWDDLQRSVASRVQAALRRGGRHGPLIAYLREAEAIARAEDGRRQTVQIIASGRRLLGDRGQVGTGAGS